jgi:hypothetical protein
MKSPSANYPHLLDRRLELLRMLVRKGEEWREAFIGLNLELSQLCAADEEIFCEQICALDRQIAKFESKQSSPANRMVDADPAIDSKILATMQLMKALHLELNRSNEIRRSILRRSQLTMNALRNLFNSYAPTYGSPAALATGTIYEESV